MKILIIIICLLAQFSFADEATDKQRSRDLNKFIMDPDVAIDRPLKSQFIPQIAKKLMGNGIVLNAQCGSLSVSDIHHFTFEPSVYCAYSPIAIDFKKREIIAFVDLIDRKFTPYARNIQAISGTVTQYMQELLDLPSSGDAKIDSLAAVLSQLSHLDTHFGQVKYTEGTLMTRPLNGLVKIDPVRKGTNWDKELYFTQVGRNGFQVKESSSEGAKYEPIGDLVSSLSNTINLLWDGYERLKVNSNDENRALLLKIITQNAQKMSKELKDAVMLMKQKSFHPIEIILVVNKLGDLIDSIDSILKDELGRGPGFVEVIQGK